MSDVAFSLPALVLVLVIYGVLGARGDRVSWCIGLLHGVLALLAFAGFGAAGDTGFAVFTGLLAVYAAAMCAAEAVHLARRPAARAGKA